MKMKDNQKMNGMKMRSGKGSMSGMSMKHSDNQKGSMSGMKMDHGSMNMGHSSGSMNMSGMSMGSGSMMMHGGHMMNMGNLKQKFWVSLILMIPILFLSPFMGMKLPFQITFPGSSWVVALLASVLFFYGGQPFFNGARGELASKQPAMMSLIALGISVAYLYSVYAVIANQIFAVTPRVNDFFWELSTLIVIMLLGHWIEMDTIMNAGSAVKKLAQLLPDQAHLIQNGQIHDVKVSQLKSGNLILIKAGEKIPADGVVKSGKSLVNESLVTGESRRVNKKAGAKVIGGANNDEGTIKVKVTGTGKSGYLAKVMKLVSSAQSHKSHEENLADRVSGYLFYAALAAAIIAFIGWTMAHSVTYAVMMAVSALVIACPHALGLAVPLVVSRTTSLAATHGLLIRNRNALEGIRKINYALMDKTGTLTQGKFKVNAVKSLNDQFSDQKVLQILAGIEKDSSHPLATGIVDRARQLHLQPDSARHVQQLTGVGLSGWINGHNYRIVAKKYLDAHSISYDRHQFNQLASRGNSVSFLIRAGQLIGIVAEGDQIKPGSEVMVQFMKQHGIVPVMLTGDNQAAAKKVANDLGIQHFEAGLLPEDKQKLVAKYQQHGHVMFIGDGINDAPSLAKANLGIAIGSGTDVAIDSADVVLVNSDPRDVINLIKLARHSNTKMIENLWWGAGYNIIAIPLAAGILAFAGIIITPTIGAIVMSLSTVVVAVNAMTLKIK